MTRQAVQFGAGNIGRGFLGQLYFESGYHTTFVDVVDGLVEALNRRGEYPLRIVGETQRTLTIGDVSAIHASDVDAVAEAVARADLASTAVGVSVLPHVAPLIAAGVARRFEDGDATPLNFILCENLIGAELFMRDQVRGHLAAQHHAALEERVGFVEASIGRMVPAMTAEEMKEDPLLVCVEPYCELPVDAAGFRGPPPPLENMQPRPNFVAYIERKLFVHNMSHATAAYLGHLRGYEYVWQAIEDETVRHEVEAALAETCRGLQAKHHLDLGDLEAHAADVLTRYGNRALGDQIARIAKDPVRKLGPNDRLIGAGQMCLAHGIEPAHVAFAAAAAIRYDQAEDPIAQALQKLVDNKGVQGVIKDVCGIDLDGRLAHLIEEGGRRLDREGWLR